MLRITDDGQWQKLQSKLGDRLLLIHFSAVSQHAPLRSMCFVCMYTLTPFDHQICSRCSSYMMHLLQHAARHAAGAR